MKLLVTGVKGQLGYDIVNECKKRNIEAVGVDVEEMDITDAKKVEEVIKEGNYDAVVHCAAWTAVDKAEDEVEACTNVNVDGTKNIANVCKELDIPMMYFSTDYVFDGQGEEPWHEYDERHPLNVYGQTKYEGELAVEALDKFFIVRIAWVFGVNGNNFIKTMLRLGKERGTVSALRHVKKPRKVCGFGGKTAAGYPVVRRAWGGQDTDGVRSHRRDGQGMLYLPQRQGERCLRRYRPRRVRRSKGARPFGHFPGRRR